MLQLGYWYLLSRLPELVVGTVGGWLYPPGLCLRYPVSLRIARLMRCSSRGMFVESDAVGGGGGGVPSPYIKTISNTSRTSLFRKHLGGTPPPLPLDLAKFVSYMAWDLGYRARRESSSDNVRKYLV